MDRSGRATNDAVLIQGKIGRAGPGSIVQQFQIGVSKPGRFRQLVCNFTRNFDGVFGSIIAWWNSIHGIEKIK